MCTIIFVIIYKQIQYPEMAQLVVQSRFAGLKIEDDDYPPTENQKSKKSKVNNSKKTEPPKKQKNVTNKPQVIF